MSDVLACLHERLTEDPGVESIAAADFTMLEDALAAQGPEGLAGLPDGTGFFAAFVRALASGDAGRPILAAAMDELQSRGAWEVLDAAARCAGGSEPDSPFAAERIRALAHGEDAGALASFAAIVAASDPRKIPARYRTAVADALDDAGVDGLARCVRLSSMESVMHKGEPDEVEAWFEAITEEATPDEVATVLAALDLTLKRDLGDRVTAYLELAGLALASRGAHRAVWNLVLGVARATGKPSEELCDLAAGALEELWSDGQRSEARIREARGAFRASDPAQELERIDRALCWGPGGFVQVDRRYHFRITACDGNVIELATPMGERREEPLDPERHRLVSADAWPVQLAFFKKDAQRMVRETPLAALGAIVESRPELSDAGLRSELTSNELIEASAWDDWFSTVREGINRGEGAVSYDARRRRFVPGAPEPKAIKRPSAARPKKKKSSAETATDDTRETPGMQGITDDGRVEFDLKDVPEFLALVKEVEKEVATLDRELRVELPRRLQVAAAHGDLSENAEYDAAKERRSYVEAHLGQLSARLMSIRKFDRIRCRENEAAIFRSVLIEDVPNGPAQTIHLVPNEFADPDRRFVSIGSPLGRGIHRKEVGEKVTLELPAGTRDVKICAVGTFGATLESS